MRKILSILTLSLAFACAAFAQSIKYDPQYEALFKAADASVSSSSESRPVIGLTNWKKASSVIAAGAFPVQVDRTRDDFNYYRDFAGMVDGFIIEGGYSSDSDLLLLKALLERNVPLMGDCEAVGKIGAGLRRQAVRPQPDIRSLVAKAGVYRHAKLLMERIVTLDSHCDMPGRYKRGYSVGKRTYSQVSIPKMVEGGLDAEVLIAFANPAPLTPEDYEKVAGSCRRMLSKTLDDIDAYKDYCGVAKSAADVRRLHDQGRKAFIIGIENAQALGHDLSNVKDFHDLGVRYMTLCHSADNDICNTSNEKRGSDPSKGLTDFGRQVVKEMNRLGMMIDLSHTSPGTVSEVCKLSAAPVVCTHSGADAVYHHDRNLTDSQIKAIAKKGGVIQVYLVDGFQNPKGTSAGIDDFFNHLKHCISVAGIDHVGIGSDFDGGGGGYGLNAANDMVNVTVRLIEEGYSDGDIAKIWGGNFLRVMEEVEKKGASIREGMRTHHTIEFQGLEREYYLYNPDSLAAGKPLVFMLHGYGGSARNYRPEMLETAIRHHFALCVPQGTPAPIGGRTGWNVGYPMQQGMEVDDVAFIAFLADHLQKKYGYSADNTFLTGMSNGGEMCYLMAWKRPDLFGAIASVAGLTMKWLPDECKAPAGTVPFIEIHGTADRSSEWTGDPTNKYGWGAYIAVPDAVGYITAASGCTGEEQYNMPLKSPERETVVHVYTGGKTEVRLYEVKGGNHSWSFDAMDTTEEIWAFFERHLKP